MRNLYNQAWSMNPVSHLTIALFALFGSPAQGADFYVDAVHGNNNNTGQTPQSAWQTITHALSQLPTGPQNLHLAAGRYDAQLGEVFPINLRSEVSLLGDTGGAPVTIASNAGAAPAVIRISDSQGPILPGTAIVGVAIEGGADSIRIDAVFDLVSIRLENVAIRHSQGAAICVGLQGADESPARVDLNLEGALIECCLEGISVFAGTQNLFGIQESFTLSAADTTIRYCSFACRFCVNAPGNRLVVGLSACRIHDYSLGFRANNFSFNDDAQIDVTITDSLIGGGQTGIALDSFSGPNDTLLIERSTIASNATVGIRASVNWQTTIIDSIVYGNGDDLDLGSSTAVSFSNIGDGDFDGMNGNISADPLFRDPALADFRLGFGTAAIDAASPGASQSLDLDGDLRSVDGDLDLSQAADMGALELHTLASAGRPRIGTTIDLEAWGEQGNRVALFLARGQPLAVPLSTPFGNAFLDPGSRFLYDVFGVPATQLPGVSQFSIPNDSSLIGTTVSFQSLVRSSAAPMQAAWAEVVSFVIGA